MKHLLALLLATSWLSAVTAGVLYTVRDITAAGTLTLTAKKDYNIWDNSGNKTTYTVDIVSPLIRRSSQEIRVAIQWQWQTRLGISNERVAFYGEVSQKHFTEYRVDRHIEVNGSYQFSNWQLPIIPKDSSALPPQNPDTIDKYTLRKAEFPEIVLENRTAQFSFTVNRDEPYTADNQIWINWGVFDSVDDTDQSKVQGPREPQLYDLNLSYSDYIDRVFINGLYWSFGLSSVAGWLALPLQIVPMLALAGYVNYVPIALLFGPSSDNFTFDNFFNEFVVRWQGGSYVSILMVIAADLLGLASLGYYGYYWYTSSSWNLTNDQWTIFGSISAVGYVFQLIITFLVGVIAVSTLSE